VIAVRILKVFHTLYKGTKKIIIRNKENHDIISRNVNFMDEIHTRARINHVEKEKTCNPECPAISPFSLPKQTFVEKRRYFVAVVMTEHCLHFLVEQKQIRFSSI